MGLLPAEHMEVSSIPGERREAPGPFSHALPSTSFHLRLLSSVFHDKRVNISKTVPWVLWVGLVNLSSRGEVMGTLIYGWSCRSTGTTVNLPLVLGVGTDVLWDSSLKLWNLRLLPGRQCWHWIELEDTPPAELLAWHVGENLFCVDDWWKNRTNTLCFFSLCF